jgi:uncharacterized protein
MSAVRPRYLVDAGPLVAFFLAGDQHHAWSLAAIRVLEEPLYTTETILAEVGHLLKRHDPALDRLCTAVHSGRIRLLSVFPACLPRVAELIRDYPGRADLGDASLVVLSELHPRATLLTIDRRDFTVYRRADGKPVPCLFPS